MDLLMALIPFEKRTSDINRPQIETVGLHTSPDDKAQQKRKLHVAIYNAQNFHYNFSIVVSNRR